MLNKYSSNQHVDLGFTYHLASSTPMCHATRSTICFACGSSIPLWRGLCRPNVKLGAIQSSSACRLFNCFLCAKCVSLASVVVVCMTSMAAHMSMQDTSRRMAAVTSCEGTEYGVDGGCRGMLAGPTPGNAAGMHGLGGGRGGVSHVPGRGIPGRAEDTNIVDGAGTSRSRGGRGGLQVGEASESESE